MKKSVCIATFNGEKYIEQQILSIIKQLSDDDELIISDDSSSDNTLQIVKSIRFKNIKIYEANTFKSPILNFENALKNATGDIIVLSDQDDIWEDNKIEVMLEYLKKYDLVISDAIIINDNSEVINPSFYELRKSGPGLFKNFYKNTYLGCCMAFNRKILDKALPFPPDIPMHDIWLGLVAEIYGNVCFCNEKLIRYRRHSGNASTTGFKSTNSIMDIFLLRKNLFVALFKRYYFVNKYYK